MNYKCLVARHWW